MKQIYLREVKLKQGNIIDSSLEVFEGDIKKDKEYWIKYHNAISVKYFRLEEIKK